MALAMIKLSNILAKSTGETLSEHTLRCLEVAESMLTKLPFEKNRVASIRADLIDAIAVHDVGKAASGFQNSLQSDGKRWGHRHEVISATFASFQKLKPEVIFAVLTHHRTISGGMAGSTKGCLGFEELPLAPEPYPIWVEMEKEWNQNTSLFEKEWNQILSKVKSTTLSPQIGLDYLSLDKEWLNRNKQHKIEYNDRLHAATLRGLLISCDHIASSGTCVNLPNMIDFSKIDSTVPSLFSFQRKTGEVKGNLILQAPTGSGKTLAALLWTYRNHKRNGRLFYSLPNTASINAMYRRLCNNYFGQDSVGLLHSRAASSWYSIWENENNSPLIRQKDAKMAKSLVRELWYPIRVCTPHQILRYTLHGKGWELMLSEFPNACFVFDEIHAYEPIITGFIVATAKLVCELNASCLFLSATMPEFLRQLIASEITQTQFLSPSSDDELDRKMLDKQRHNIQIMDGNILENIDYLVKAVNKAKSTLIVCNHVPSAQRIFDEFQNRSIENSVLLHSRFCRRDRDSIEKTIQLSLPKVLIATQVVEVSLDVDFEQGFFEPAPIDATIQRLGRVNRKGDRPPANVIVFKEQITPHHIYSKDTVNRSLDKLEHLTNPLRENDLIEVANQVYQSGYCDEDRQQYNNALNHPLIKEFREKLTAGCHNDWTEEIIDESDGTIEVLPSSLKQEYTEALSEGRWLDADRLLVPIRTSNLSYLVEYLDKNFDPWIIKKQYTPIRGLSLNSMDKPE